jgi:phosphoadenosine phosphosulfate reductase
MTPDSSTPAQALDERYVSMDAAARLEHFVTQAHPGRVAIAASFGAESAVLLDLTAAIDRHLPIVFLNTGKLFGETLDYRDTLVAHLGLTNVIELAPDAAALRREDPSGTLWLRDPDRCCALRKAAPLRRALAPYDAWVNGRKRFHGGLRGALSFVESVDGKVKLNALADWSRDDLDAYMTGRGLPRHPVAQFGFTSIGCEPCSDPAASGAEVRAGRWSGLSKTECGIHLPHGPAPGGAA